MLSVNKQYLAYPYYPSNEASFEQTSIGKLNEFIDGRDLLECNNKSNISK